jgi:hypothetical protein
VLSLAETTVLTDLHDAELAQATREIKFILKRVEAANQDPDRILSPIQIGNLQLLVWANCTDIGPKSSERELARVFKLKA